MIHVNVRRLVSQVFEVPCQLPLTILLLAPPPAKGDVNSFISSCAKLSAWHLLVHTKV